jgi:hypothetical protein
MLHLHACLVSFRSGVPLSESIPAPRPLDIRRFRHQGHSTLLARTYISRVDSAFALRALQSTLDFFLGLHNTSEKLATHAHSSLWIHARKPYS